MIIRANQLWQDRRDRPWQADPSFDPTIPAILLGYSLSNEGVQITSKAILENPTDAQ